MKSYDTFEEAQGAAHPGSFIMKNARLPIWAVVSMGERERLKGSGTWSTVERKRAYHDVVAEAETDWASYDIVVD